MFSGDYTERESESDSEVDESSAASYNDNNNDGAHFDGDNSGGAAPDDDMSVWTIPLVDSAFRSIKKVAYDSAIDRCAPEECFIGQTPI